jgi:molybdenum cofactor cytidylyltransferase
MRASPAVAGIILAAGLGRRMGGAKVLLPWQGRPLVRHLAQVALESRLHEALVVTGHRAVEVAAALSDLPVRIVYNQDYQSGLSSSLRAGIAALPRHITGAMILLADQPRLDAAVINRLLEAHARTGAPIVAAFARERRGAPVLFDRALFAEIMALDGDQGARRVVDAHFDRVCRVEVDEAVLEDVDTPEAYADLAAANGATSHQPSGPGPEARAGKTSPD